MFVRWKSKRTRAGAVHSAVLVKSVRQAGKPKQVFVAHLGSIRESDLRDPGERRNGAMVAYFWRTVDNQLASLDLDENAKCAVCSQVAKRIPRPSRDELARADHERAEHEAAIDAARFWR